MNSNPSTRTGKIARLPHSIRQETNRRLRERQPSRIILSWLNNLPEVQNILAAQFAGRPINKQNLSQWRVGGFREWLATEEAFESVLRLENSADLSHPIFTLIFSLLPGAQDFCQGPVKPSQSSSRTVKANPA